MPEAPNSVLTLEAIWHLPPLILHPFGGGASTDELMAGSKAALALQGLSKSDLEKEDLEQLVLIGRYHEIRMLVFLGKDIFRWLEQCVEHIQRAGGDPKISEQTLAAVVVENPPLAVARKLERWGVSDRKAIFSRAIGMRSILENPPPMEAFAASFLMNYHRFADYAYVCFQHLKPFYQVDAKRFDFHLYASDEYTQLLTEEFERGMME